MAIQPVQVKHSAAPAPVNVNDNWHAFRREIEHVFDRFSNGFGAWNPFGNIERLWPRSGFVSLAIDVAEGDKAYTVTAELPGIDEKNVNVSVKGDMLVIEGEKQQEKEEKGTDSFLSERTYGAFKRCFTLPDDVDSAKIGAQFAKGILTVTLPKTAQAQNARKIEVKAA